MHIVEGARPTDGTWTLEPDGAQTGVAFVIEGEPRSNAIHRADRPAGDGAAVRRLSPQPPRKPAARRVWQSVQDKATLAAEINRVLRPGGRLALLEVSGDDAALEYPVPWADGPGESFVISTAQLGEVLEGAGLVLEDWRIGAEAQAAVIAATQDSVRMAAGVPGVGLDLLMPDYAARMAGLAANVEAGLKVPALTPRRPTDVQSRATRINGRGWSRLFSPDAPPAASRSDHLRYREDWDQRAVYAGVAPVVVEDV